MSKPSIAKNAHEVMERVYLETELLSETIIFINDRLSDGTYTQRTRLVKKKRYTSEFWKKESNGEREIYVAQGGIRATYIPSDEKDRLKAFLAPYFLRFYRTLEFYGSILVENVDGSLVLFKILPK